MDQDRAPVEALLECGQDAVEPCHGDGFGIADRKVQVAYLGERCRMGDSERVSTVSIWWGLAAASDSASSEQPRKRRSEIFVRGRRSTRLLIHTEYEQKDKFGQCYWEN